MSTRLPTALVAPTVAGVGDPFEAVLDLLTGRRIVALTGAGLSTDSGIPDYRGPTSPRRNPMTYQEFCATPAARRRYWARSHVGWALMGRARPNAGHHALADLQHAGVVRGLITQNVDGLHTAAGSPSAIDLHGRIADVICLGCGEITGRDLLQARLALRNPGFVEVMGAQVESAPDGDAELAVTDGFCPVDCVRCGGVLKPDVVFFGENVPRPRVEAAYAMVDALAGTTDTPSPGALLVVGSSLTVMSGLRFVRHAHRLGVPVAIVNRGVTRGDDHAHLHLEAGCSPTLSALAAALA